MGKASTDQLKQMIESQHGGSATFHQSLRLQLPASILKDWDGIVHVFDLSNHPTAKLAYAWSSGVRGSSKPRYFAVLQSASITGPVEAVKAAVTAIRNAERKVAVP